MSTPTVLPAKLEARENLLTKVLAFRAAVNETLATNDWEWALFTLGKAVRHFPQRHGAPGDLYSTLLRSALEHACELVADHLNDKDPAESLRVQHQLRVIGAALHGIEEGGQATPSAVSAFQGVAERTRDRYLRLLCSWACFSAGPTPSREHGSLLFDALRDCGLSETEAKIRRAVGRHLLTNRTVIQTGPRAEQEQLAIAAVRAHGQQVPLLLDYVESLVHVILGWADHSLEAVLRGKVALLGGSINGHILAWAEKEKRDALREARRPPPRYPISGAPLVSPGKRARRGLR